MSVKLKQRIVHRPDMDKPRSKVGLGDAVAAVAQPIAKAVDAVFGTELQRCGGCEQRKEKLNRFMPDITKQL
jgi:hypothetical protein